MCLCDSCLAGVYNKTATDDGVHSAEGDQSVLHLQHGGPAAVRQDVAEIAVVALTVSRTSVLLRQL